MVAVRGFAPFPALMLTLERMGVRRPSIYVAAVLQAEKLTDLDQARGSAALALFAGALALLSRLVRARTIDAATGERLAGGLFAARLADGRFGGAIAAWINDRLRPALAIPSGNPTLDEVLLAAGVRATGDRRGRQVEWEGQLIGGHAGAELQRLRGCAAGGLRFRAGLGVAASPMPRRAVGHARDRSRRRALTAVAAERARAPRRAKTRNRDHPRSCAGAGRIKRRRCVRRAQIRRAAGRRSDVMPAGVVVPGITRPRRSEERFSSPRSVQPPGFVRSVRPRRAQARRGASPSPKPATGRRTSSDPRSPSTSRWRRSPSAGSIPIAFPKRRC